MYLEFKRKELDDQDAMRDVKERWRGFVIRYVIVPICSCFGKLDGIRTISNYPW